MPLPPKEEEEARPHQAEKKKKKKKKKAVRCELPHLGFLAPATKTGRISNQKVKDESER